MHDFGKRTAYLLYFLNYGYYDIYSPVSNFGEQSLVINELPLGQIGQGQTPFLFGFKYWILPIIILLALAVSLGSLGGTELKLGRKMNKNVVCQFSKGDFWTKYYHTKRKLLCYVNRHCSEMSKSTKIWL